MPGPSRRSRQSIDIWPGFVDALATLLMVIIFLLMIFVLAQFFLGQALSGREEAMGRLERQVSELADLLALERKANAELRIDLRQLSTQLQETQTDKETLSGQLAAMSEQAAEATAEADRLTADVAALRALRDELEAKVKELGATLGEERGQLAEERRISDEARARAALLAQQLAALRNEMARLADALEASEALAAERKVEIANLGKRLNAALAGKVQELARAKSEFFGRLREVLGDRPGIRVEGDRFVFQSEVLFASASADLNEAGRAEIAALAPVIIDIAREIPTDLNWYIRVNGHTDERPIRTADFANNWELSAARAISVVRFLIDQGVPAQRLAAAGFGEYQPIDAGSDDAAYRRNRRIELKLDSR